jgi:ATPase components of ABC transporters with duplicated ATPase domains
MDRVLAQGAPGQVQGALPALRGLLKQASEKQTQTAQITIPVAERLGQNVVDFEGPQQSLWRRVLIDDLTFKLPPGGIVGVIGPTAPARPRCSG